MKISQGLVLLPIAVAGVIIFNIYDNPAKTLFYILFGFSLVRINDYWGEK